MKPLFVSSTGALAGQTLVAWMLLREMKARGKRPGFYKPLGYADPQTGVDPDASLFGSLLDLAEPPDALCPFTLESYRDHAVEFTAEDFLRKVRNGFDGIAAGHDAMVVVGSSDIFVKPDFLGLPDGKFIDLIDAKVVLVDTFESLSNTVYSALSVGSFLGTRLAALIVNHVPDDAIPALRVKLAPLSKLLESGSVALVPEDPVMAAYPVGDYATLLQGSVLAGDNKLDRLVCRTTIGNEPLAGGLRIVRRVNNKITLLGGTVNELADPAFRPRPVAILITAGRMPPEVVVEAAGREGVALVAVSADSFGVLDRLEATRFQLRLGHAYKVERMAHHLAGQLDMDRLLASL